MKQLFYTSCYSLALPVWLLIGMGTCYSQHAIAYVQQEIPNNSQDPGKTMLLREALKLLEGHYEVDIVFGDRIIQNFSVSQVHIVLNGSLEENLNRILKPTGLRYKKIGNSSYAVLAKSSRRKPVPEEAKNTRKIALPESQITTPPFPLEELVVPIAERKISGQVKDEKEEPLPGVNILVKDTQQGVITDSDGKFSIEVPDENAVLVFSFVGYATQEVVVGNRTNLALQLKVDQKSLDELIVIGYQKRQRGEITGSIAEIGGSEVEKTSSPSNITRALQGRIPGLKISDRGGDVGAANLDILLRGKSTLGNNSPLVVIDGVPAGLNELSYLSSKDIESISVLKDASAAIYGARSANGVILVTTKVGSYKGKSEISLSANYSLQAPTKLNVYMNSYERAVWENEYADYKGILRRWSDQQVAHFKNQDSPLEYPNTDWVKEVIRDFSPMRDLNLSARGGNEKIQYYVSGNLLGENDVYRSNDINFHNYQSRINIKANVTKNLRVGINTMYRYEKRRTVPNSRDIWSNLVGARHIVSRYPNGLLGPGVSGTGENAITRSERKYHFIDNDKKTFNFIFDLFYDMSWMLKGLELTGMANYSNIFEFNKEFRNAQWDMYSYDSVNDAYIPVQSIYGGGVRTVEDIMENAQTDFYNIKLNYSKYFGKNTISGFVAYEQSEFVSNNVSAFARGLPLDTKPYLWAGEDAGRRNNGTKSETGRVNYFGSIFYNYSNKYLVDASLRFDGSFNFAKDRRFGLFSGFSAGYIISEESIVKDIDWIDNLKLRLSYGKMGNDAVSSYQYVSRYRWSNAYDFGVVPMTDKGFFLSNVPNARITWEVSKQKNIGIDFSVLKGTFGLTIDYFYEKRRGILIPNTASVPVYTGLQLPAENRGSVDNKGIEFALQHQKKIRDLQYFISGNISYSRNKVIYLAEPSGVADYQKVEGFPIDSWLVYKTDGIYRSQDEIDASTHLIGTIPGDIRYVDMNGDGQIGGEDLYRRRTSAIPEVQFGFNTRLVFKNFDIDLFFQGQSRVETNIAQSGRMEVYHKEMFDGRWTKDNPNSKWPRSFISDDTNIARGDSDFWLFDATMLRFKSMHIGYDLPSNITSKMGLSKMSVFLRGRNLLTFSDLPANIDPEKEGTNSYYHPQIRTYTLGAQIAF